MNHLAVISGGTQGIGRAIVTQFASQNFDIITCARSEAALNELKDFINPHFPHISIGVYVADLSQKAEVLTFTDAIKSMNRPVEVLVNNVGVFMGGQTYNEPDSTLERMIETNLYSAYYLTQGLVGGMIENKKGHIFNICSTASITAYTNGGSYCISKFALYGYTKLLREELKAKHIKVTAVLPGATYTPSWDGADLPPARLMPAEDVANSIWSAYQMSDRTVIEEIILRPQLGDL